MKIVNVLFPLLVIVFSIFTLFGFKSDRGVYYDIGNYGWLILVSCFTISWAWALHILYRDTTHSEKLLPDKRIFIVHGSLLTLFLLLNAFEIYAYWKKNNTESDYALLVWADIYNLTLFLASFVEAMTFSLVIFLMLPMGENQKMQRKEFQRFLFVGFIDRKELEKAIHVQYPDLTDTEKKYIHVELDEMEEMMTQSTQNITGGMVRVTNEEQEQLAFRTWMDFRIKRIRETYSTLSSLTDAPRMISSVSNDGSLLDQFSKRSSLSSNFSNEDYSK